MTTKQVQPMALLALVGLALNCGGPDTTIVIPAPVIEIPGVPRAAVEAFEEGVSNLESMPPDYVAARANFEEVVALDPDFWEAWMNLGVLYTDLALYSDAVAAFEQVLEWPDLTEDPDVLAATMGIGRAHALGGNTASALQAYGDVIRQDDTNLDARNNIAAIYVENGDHAQARTFIGEVLIAEQNNVGALNLLARIYSQEGNVQMASYLWEKVIELDENATDPRNNLGLMFVSDGEMSRAVRQFTRVVQNDPANVAAHLNLGAIYLTYLNYTGACGEFAQVVALRPRHESGLMGFAACAYGQGDAQVAYDRYLEVNGNYPENMRAMYRLGELAFRDLDDLASAESWYDRYLRLKGLNGETCTADDDPVCARIQGVRQMMRQTTPRSPEESDGDTE